LNEGIVE